MTAGALAVFLRRSGTVRVVTPDGSELTIPVDSIDDGSAVVPHYVGGWNKKFTRVFLYPFPVNPDGRRRHDNGRVIDYSTWAIGPRRSYHVKVQR